MHTAQVLDMVPRRAHASTAFNAHAGRASCCAVGCPGLPANSMWAGDAAIAGECKARAQKNGCEGQEAPETHLLSVRGSRKTTTTTATCLKITPHDYSGNVLC